jgi:hypothetical protein
MKFSVENHTWISCFSRPWPDKKRALKMLKTVWLQGPFNYIYNRLWDGGSGACVSIIELWIRMHALFQLISNHEFKRI